MKIAFVSLGCDKNLADTELMLEILRRKGYEFTDDAQEADAAVVNTCCFIGDAKEESINTVLELAELRREGRLKALVAAGCLAQRYGKEIREEIPEVDGLVGTAAIEDILEAVETALSGEKRDFFRDLDSPPAVRRERVLTTGGHFAYLKIAEGCNKRCTYCVIPLMLVSQNIPIQTLQSSLLSLSPLLFIKKSHIKRFHIDMPNSVLSKIYIED